MNTLIIGTVIKAAQASHVAPALLLALCTVESTLKPKAINHYDGGSASYGVCQIKLETAVVVSDVKTTKQLMRPNINAKVAGLYLSKQLIRYNYNLECAIAAYNAGSCRFNKNGLIKNRKYVRKVMHWFRVYKSKYQDLSNFASTPYNEDDSKIVDPPKPRKKLKKFESKACFKPETEIVLTEYASFEK